MVLALCEPQKMSRLVCPILTFKLISIGHQPVLLKGTEVAVRSTLTVSADRSGMTARWERSDDGASWQPWMDMTFTWMP